MATRSLPLAGLVACALLLTGCPEIEQVTPDPAEPGAEITLAGTGFGATPRPVFYDGETIEVGSWSDTEIVATLPEGKAPGDYVVAIGAPRGLASATHTIDIPGMSYVPAGEFTMGGTLLANESPVHAIYLDAYWIDTHEVTVEEYVACFEVGACTLSSGNTAGGVYDCRGPTDDGGVNGDPGDAANCHNWGSARIYCEWAGKRLPTEAEWEKAARGTDARTYPWGETVPSCDRAVLDQPLAGGPGCGTGAALPPGSRPLGASPYGVLDMAGNLAEWVADPYDADYYAESPYENPQGPAEPTFHYTLRGGSWQDQNPALFRTATRIPVTLGGIFWMEHAGMRCARDG